MRILGIDPGYGITGFGLIEADRGSSKLLQWCGEHLFSLYILQRIPMIALQYLGLGERSIPLYFACCVVITVCMVYPFERVTDQIWNKLDKMISPKHAAC